jgi:hypothetical protein
LTCLKKWAEAIGAGPIITLVAVNLETTPSPEYRKLGLGFIVELKEGIKESDHPLLIKPLCECLNDKNGEIRGLAEQVVVEVMGYIGAKKFNVAMKDLKKAVADKIQPIIKRCEGKVVPKDQPATAEPENVEMV